jgi:hypothetical protein
VTWAAWADIDPKKIRGTEKQARLEEIPAALFYLKLTCRRWMIGKRIGRIPDNYFALD